LEGQADCYDLDAYIPHMGEFCSGRYGGIDSNPRRVFDLGAVFLVV